MISVIVPVYNVEKYLDDCIESLIHQSYRNIEIILVNDGSTDSSPSICDQHARLDSRIKVVHQKNGGQSSARNTGLKFAKGRFVTFVDSDDWVDFDFCHTLYNIIEDADLAICSHRIVTQRGNKKDEKSRSSLTRRIDNDALWHEVFGQLNNAAWNKLYRKELLDGIIFPPDMYHGEDLIFNLEYITRCNSAVITNKCLYNYYRHPGSVTTSGFSPRKIFEITTKDTAFEFIRLHKPSMLATAVKYCFRARLNVLRSIYLARVEKKQNQLVDECKGYLKYNYSKARKALSIKDRLEYRLLSYPFFYRQMLKVIQ